MSKAQQAAEEQFDRDDDDYAALVVGFTEGWEAALPENPDPAVIEAMAEAANGALAPLLGQSPEVRFEQSDLTLALAMYAALRGAMQ